MQSTRLIRATVALCETSEVPVDEAGDGCRPLEHGLERGGGVEVDFAAIEVLLNVGTAFGRGWRLDGGRRGGWVMVEHGVVSKACLLS